MTFKSGIITIANNPIIKPTSQLKIQRVHKGGDFTHAEMMEASKIKVLKFYSDGCFHCRNLAPEYEKLSDEHDDNKSIEFFEIDVSTRVHSELYDEYNITGIPFTAIVVDSELHGTVVGNDIESLKNAVENLTKTKKIKKTKKNKKNKTEMYESEEESESEEE